MTDWGISDPSESFFRNLLVERWFRELTDKQIRRGVFRSVSDLVEAIHEFLKAHNEEPKPFVWTANVETILRKVSKCKAILDTVH